MAVKTEELERNDEIKRLNNKLEETECLNKKKIT